MNNKRILIVDDEVSVLNTLKRLFRTKPYDVRVAESGEQALALLAEQGADLVISDMRMPNMSGAELLAEVKARLPLSESILLTGYSDMKSTISAINDGGIFGYLSKPWDPSQLLALVERALAQSHKKRLKNGALKHYKRCNDELSDDLARKEREMAQSAQFVDHAFQTINDHISVTQQVLLNMLALRHRAERDFADTLSTLALQMAGQLGLAEQEQITLEAAARLHGLGKIALSEELLTPALDSLSAAQRTLYRQYPSQGASMLMAYDNLQDIAQVIFEQCEYLDGSGFPSGLGANDISYLGRILCVCRDYAELRLGRRTGALLDHEQALATMSAEAQRYDASLLPSLSTLTLDLRSEDAQQALVLPLYSLQTGMVLREDLYSEAEVLLLPAGSVLNDNLIGHLMCIERNSEQKLLVDVYFDADEHTAAH